MTRTIKFRGKDIETNEWVYGFLVIKEVPKLDTFDEIKSNFDGETLFENKSFIYNEDDDRELEDNFIEVIPESVGQYIGLKDKNKKKIYENDFIIQNDDEELIFGWVEWDKDNARFQINDIINNEQFCFDYDVDAKDLEVEGNKSDTPDIMNNVRDDRV